MPRTRAPCVCRSTAGLHGVVASEAPVTATLTVDNDSDEPVPAGRLTVEINKTPLSDSDELTAWLTAGDAAGSFTSLGTTEADEVAASDSSTTSISAPAAAIGDIDAGVYPIKGTLSGETSADILDTTSVLIVDADSSREITVLVPITATPEDGGLLTAEELDELTAPDGALTAQLDGVAGTSAVLAVDPLIPAAIRALGTAAPTSATAWLTRLESLSNERFTLQAGDADATVQARAGLDEPLEPLPLTPYLLPENFIEPTPSPSPSPSPTPTAPEMPDYEELTDIRSSEAGILWPLGDAQTGDLAVFDEYLGDRCDDDPALDIALDRRLRRRRCRRTSRAGGDRRCLGRALGCRSSSPMTTRPESRRSPRRSRTSRTPGLSPR